MDTPACASGCGGLWGCTRHGGCPSIALAFCLSPGYPRAQPCHGRGMQGAAGSVERWGCSGSLLQVQRLSVGRGMGVPFQTQGSAPERLGPAPHSLGDASSLWDGTGLQLTHGAPRGSRGLSLPLLCTIFTFFWVQTEAQLSGLWLPGSGTGGSCRFVSRDAGDPTVCWSSDAFAGVRAVPCRRSQALCRPGPPKPPLCWWPPEKCLFFVVETQRQQGLLSGAVGARDLGLSRARRAPTPRMSVVSS